MRHAAWRADGAQDTDSACAALGEQIVEGGEVVVALDQRRTRADARDQALVETPHGRRDRCIVRVDQQRVAQRRVGAVAGKVDFVDQRAGKPVDVGLRGEAHVAAADEDVVHVEQQPAAAAPREFGEKIDFVQFVLVHAQVVRRILDGDPPPERFLHAVDVVADARERLRVARKRQQVGMVGAAPGRPGEVLGDQRRLESIDQGGQSRKVCRVGFGIGRQRHADAVQRKRVPRANGFQPRQARTAVDHVVFRMDLEPQTVRGSGVRRLVVRGLESQPRGTVVDHGLVPECRVDQLLIGVSEPMPLGVFIVVQVPLATFFQALPW